jgi:hypothetical protein
MEFSMSAQTLAEAFAPAEAAHRRAVMAETWGHLAPRKHRTYRGHIVFAFGCFGSDALNPTCLDWEFKGLNSSPWFFEALDEWLQNYGKSKRAGQVWRWEGIFRNYKFHGKFRKVYDAASGTSNPAQSSLGRIVQPSIHRRNVSR